MGIWNTNLYGNDTAADIRDTYIECLYEKMSNEDAYQKTYNEFVELIGTDEEPLLWYALADVQCTLGRLMPDVKKKALEYICRDVGLLFEDNDKKAVARWKKTLQKLADKLNAPLSSEKRIPVRKDFVRNPWNIGDVYLYQFHSDKAKIFDLYGKYIAFQKTGDVESYGGKNFSIIQIYDKVFLSCPSINEIVVERKLPLVFPPNVKGTPKCTAEYIPSFEWYLEAIMLCEKQSDYSKRYFTFVGNSYVPDKKYQGNTCSEAYWGNVHMEDWIIDYVISWKNIEY